MNGIKKWLRYFFCEHDWKDKAEFEVWFQTADGKKIDRGHAYTKECSKCHRIWTQRAP